MSISAETSIDPQLQMNYDLRHAEQRADELVVERVG